jgi:hypothetical protein
LCHGTGCTLADLGALDGALAAWPDEDRLLGGLASSADLAGILLHGLLRLVLLSILHGKITIHIPAILVKLDRLPGILGGLRGISGLLSGLVVLDSDRLILRN